MVKDSVSLEELRERFALLTANERDVLTMVLDNEPNARIAAVLDMGLRTVELRRAKTQAKLGARHLLEVVRFAVLVDFPNEQAICSEFADRQKLNKSVRSSGQVSDLTAPLITDVDVVTVTAIETVRLPPIRVEPTAGALPAVITRPHSLDEIAERFCISRQRAQQIEQKALQKLRRAIMRDDETRQIFETEFEYACLMS